MWRNCVQIISRNVKINSFTFPIGCNVDAGRKSVIDAGLTKFPKVTVILRGYNYEQVRCVVRSMVGTKLGAIEVAMNTPGAAQIIEKGRQ
jgi:hypothetical protein